MNKVKVSLDVPPLVVPKAGATTPEEAIRLPVVYNLDGFIGHVKHCDVTTIATNF